MPMMETLPILISRKNSENSTLWSVPHTQTAIFCLERSSLYMIRIGSSVLVFPYKIYTFSNLLFSQNLSFDIVVGCTSKK